MDDGGVGIAAFTPVNLGVAAGRANSIAEGINLPGLVAGVSYNVDPALDGTVTAWNAGGATNIGVPAGFVAAEGKAINDFGDIVGIAYGAAGRRGFVWTPAGGFSILAGPPGATDVQAWDIEDNALLVVGEVTVGGAAHAFRWQPGSGYQDLHPAGYLSSHANAIAPNGGIAGWAKTAAGDEHAVMWSPAGAFFDLGTLPGGAHSQGHDVNSAGAVVGQSQQAGGTMVASIRRLPAAMQVVTPLATSVGSGLSDLGRVVGWAPWANLPRRAATRKGNNPFVFLPMLAAVTLASDAREVNRCGHAVGSTTPGRRAGPSHAMEQGAVRLTDATLGERRPVPSGPAVVHALRPDAVVTHVTAKEAPLIVQVPREYLSAGRLSPSMKLQDLVLTSAAVGATAGRLEKISLLATLLQRLEPNEIPIAIGFLTGWPRQGKLGIGWAAIEAARPNEAVDTPALELYDVDRAFDELKAVRGKGSAAERLRQLADLLARSTAEEQRFLATLAIGEVRQGALDAVILEAVARAAGLPSDRVRRAVMLAGDLGTVARAVLSEGEVGLASYQVELFRPVQPMLADSAPNVSEALALLEQAVLEWKLDGARIQVHRRDDRIAVYTRSLNDVTAAVPEVVEAVRALPARELILDGEVIALDGAGRPLPFQVTMRRFGRKLQVEALQSELPVTPFFFDVLWCDGEDLMDRACSERVRRLDEIAPSAMRVPRIVTADIQEAKAFEADALTRGHEGLMAKSLSAPYAAGRRGSAWLKVKTARTMDLVVLAVEWGSGRRKGWLSNLHLGARDPVTGGFVMLGKTFKGLTDETLAWQTKELLARETTRDGHVVYVRPELVVEIAFNEVQSSSQYPGGVALRFARVKGYRPDKRAADADTIDAVRAFLPGTDDQET